MDETWIRILSVDDHALVREGIAAVINQQPDMKVVAEAATGQHAIAQFREHRPHVTLLDLRLPDMDGLRVLASLLNESPGARVIMLTTFSGDVEIQRAMEGGAHGYLLKSMPPQEMFQLIRRVHAGKKHLSPEISATLAQHYSDERLTRREIEILEKLAAGNRNLDIAKKLFISEETVKAHMKNILQKLVATDRTHAVAIGLRRGFIHL